MNTIRSSIVCRRKARKDELLRIVSCNELATLDREQNISLRGIYFCKDKKCLEKAKELLRKDKLVLKKHFNKESLIKIIDNIENELGE